MPIRQERSPFPASQVRLLRQLTPRRVQLALVLDRVVAAAWQPEYGGCMWQRCLRKLSQNGDATRGGIEREDHHKVVLVLRVANCE